MKRSLPLLFAALLFLNACNNEQAIPSEQLEGTIPQLTYADFPYDEVARDLAATVSAAVRGNAGFRKLVQSEALRKFDGDYDVLIKNISAKEVSSHEVALTRGGSGRVSVSGLLNHYSAENIATTRSGGEPGIIYPQGDIIAVLEELYPTMQVSIPVHAEDWDPETYTPAVAYVPEDCDDATVVTIPAIDADGNWFELDAVNPPDVPVIVVGPCERVDEQGNLLMLMSGFPEDDGDEPTEPEEPEEPGCGGDPDTPIVYSPVPNDLNFIEKPTELKATIIKQGINLTWKHPQWDHDPALVSYEVYRQSENEMDFTLVTTRNGLGNRAYVDADVVTRKTYNYYLTATFMNNGVKITSDLSDGVTAIAHEMPDAPSVFEVNPSGSMCAELRWTNDNDIYSSVKIYRKIGNGNYTEIGTFNNETEYVDNIGVAGIKVTYKAERVNDYGKSDPKYDFLYVPYRDFSTPSLVYIEAIMWNKKYANDIEKWYRGSPEFYITVAGIGDNNNAVTIQDQLTMDIPNVGGNKAWQSWFNPYYESMLVAKWRDEWFNALTFYIEEYNRWTKDRTVSANASRKEKDRKILEILDSDVSFSVSFSDKGKYMGQAALYYYDYPTVLLKFPKYGIKLYISDRIHPLQ